MMLGEPQILGQVKEAYRLASDAGTIGSRLSPLLDRAFAVAKRVRSETGISQSAVSISYAAVELARKIFGDLSGKTVMIIGASKMGELAAKHLKRNGVASVLVDQPYVRKRRGDCEDLRRRGDSLRTLHRSHRSRGHRDQLHRSAALHHYEAAGGAGDSQSPKQAGVLHRYCRAPRCRSVRQRHRQCVCLRHRRSAAGHRRQHEGTDEGGRPRRGDRRSGSSGLLHTHAVARGALRRLFSLRDTLEKVRREEIERHRRLLRDMPADQQEAALAPSIRSRSR